MKRAGILYLSIAAGAALLLVATVLVRSLDFAAPRPPAKTKGAETAFNPSVDPSRERAVEAVRRVEPLSQGKALHDAALLGLIRNARTASRKGDVVTRGAMLNGLKKEPARSRELIEQEMARAESGDAEALRGLLAELP